MTQNETARGLVHIYCGDGKGKTSCAAGLALRAAHSGMQVVILQFLKDGTSHEMQALAALPFIDGLRLFKPEKGLQIPNSQTPLLAQTGNICTGCRRINDRKCTVHHSKRLLIEYCPKRNVIGYPI